MAGLLDLARDQGAHRLVVATGPTIRTIGLPGDEDFPLAEAIEELEDEARRALDSLDRSSRGDDEAVRTLVSRKVKKACQRIWDRRPIVETVVLRI